MGGAAASRIAVLEAELEQARSSRSKLEAEVRRERRAVEQLRSTGQQAALAVGGCLVLTCLGGGLLLRQRIRGMVLATERRLSALHEVQLIDVRRRAALDVEKAQKFAVSALARDLLSVADSLEWARLHMQTAAGGSSLSSLSEGVAASRSDGDPFARSDPCPVTEGIGLTERSLLQALEKHSVERQPVAPGDIFDPQAHEAVRRVEDAILEGRIVEVFRSGYMIYDRVLRAAQVVVAVKPPIPAPEGGGGAAESTEPSQQPAAAEGSDGGGAAAAGLAAA